MQRAFSLIALTIPSPLRGGLGRGAADKPLPNPTSPHPTSPARGEAFSLVELSIVLVILGLLVGGILAGQSLIRAAELRSVGTEYNRIATATHAFRDKYFATPGDMPNATSFWGASDAGDGLGADCISNTSSGTCNGNGDGVITPWVYSGYEDTRAWQHLAFAGLIEGKYTGAPQSNQLVPKINIPGSAITNAGWWLRLTKNSVPIDYRTTLILGTPPSGFINRMDGPSLTPTDAWNIDRKLDDGDPTTGLFYGQTGQGSATACLAGNAYDFTITTIACVIRFNMN